MPTPTITLTHCGKLGDFLYCLPIASWIHKRRGVKIHFVFPRMFEPFQYITPLLERQAFTEKVTLVDHQVRDYGAGGQPYKFHPPAFGIEGLYYNLGIRHYPDKFLTAYCAEEHGLGWDPDFTLDLGEVEPTGDILRGEQPEIAAMCPASRQYPIPMDLLTLGRMLKAAAERHLWYSGPAALLYLARIPFKLYWERGHPPRDLYLNESYFGGRLIESIEYQRRPQ